MQIEIGNEIIIWSLFFFHHEDIHWRNIKIFVAVERVFKQQVTDRFEIVENFPLTPELLIRLAFVHYILQTHKALTFFDIVNYWYVVVFFIVAQYREIFHRTQSLLFADFRKTHYIFHLWNCYLSCQITIYLHSVALFFRFVQYHINRARKLQKMIPTLSEDT